MLEWTRGRKAEGGGRRAKGQVDEAVAISSAVVMDACYIRQLEAALVRYPARPKRSLVYVTMKEEHVKYIQVSYNTWHFMCAAQD